jgi:protein O-GlcNAc transferase
MSIAGSAEKRFDKLLKDIAKTGPTKRSLRTAQELCTAYPGQPAAWHALGAVAMECGDFAQARTAFERALGLAPADLDLASRLGMVLSALGQHDAAAEMLERAVAKAPSVPQLWNNLGNVRALRDGRTVGSMSEIDAFRRAIALDPAFNQARLNLARALLQRGDIDEAQRHWLHCLGDPACRRDAALGLIECSVAQARNAQVQALLREHGSMPEIAQDALFYANYDETLSPTALAQRHSAWGAKIAQATRTRKFGPVNLGGTRGLRVGLLSPDLRRHPVAWFVRPLLEGTVQDETQIHLYFDAPRGDAISETLAARAAGWHAVANLDEDDLAAKLRADRIDLLVDLTGHTQGNRLPAFARRLAPYQATWLGYPHSTGLRAVDFRLVDAITDPPSIAEPFNTETLLHIDGCFVCYGPPEDAPAIFERAADAPIVFGSANNFLKVGPKTIALWAEILAKVPQGRLLLRYNRLFENAAARANVQALFAAHNIDPARLDFRGRSEDPFAFYREVDIALDPLNYNGTTTTCETLWMGVPVVTLRGDRHAARVGASLLTAAGLPQLVAEDAASYVALAAHLAEDVGHWRATRAQMRATVASSRLLDAKGFARSWRAAIDAGLAQRV